MTLTGNTYIQRFSPTHTYKRLSNLMNNPKYSTTRSSGGGLLLPPDERVVEYFGFGGYLSGDLGSAVYKGRSRSVYTVISILLWTYEHSFIVRRTDGDSVCPTGCWGQVELQCSILCVGKKFTLPVNQTIVQLQSSSSIQKTSLLCMFTSNRDLHPCLPETGIFIPVFESM